MFAKNKVSQSMIDAVNKVLATESKKQEPEQLDEASFPDYAALRKQKEGPKPSGGSGIKQGKAYGGGKQASEPEDDEAEKKPAKREKYGARQQRFTDTKLYKEEGDDCVSEPEVKNIAKKEVGKHEKGMHGKKGEVAKHEKEMHKESFASRLVESMYGKKSALPVDEREMTDAEKDKKEKIAKAMKKTPEDEAAMKKRYGSRWKEVLYATATKKAMKEEKEEDDKDEGHEDEKEDKALVKKLVKKDALKEKLDYSNRTTDTLAGRVKGGKDNEHFSSKVKLEGDVEESGLRNKAHASAAAGKKSFEFLGKTLPVTVKKEEVEQVDEISSDLAYRAWHKASKLGDYHNDKNRYSAAHAYHQQADRLQAGAEKRRSAEKDAENRKAVSPAKARKMKMEEVELTESPIEKAKKVYSGMHDKVDIPGGRTQAEKDSLKAKVKNLNAQPKKLKSFSSMKKEMLGKAGMTSEKKDEE